MRTQKGIELVEKSGRENSAVFFDVVSEHSLSIERISIS